MIEIVEAILVALDAASARRAAEVSRNWAGMVDLAKKKRASRGRVAIQLPEKEEISCATSVNLAEETIFAFGTQCGKVKWRKSWEKYLPFFPVDCHL